MIKNSPIENVYIAAPCNADWNDMQGDDRVRMCSLCSKKVYNLSDMTRNEAEEFLITNGVTQCMRIFRRNDGTVITDNCPVGLRKLRNGLRLLSRSVAAFLGFVCSANFVGGKMARADDSGQPAKRFSPIAIHLGVPSVYSKDTSMITTQVNCMQQLDPGAESVVIAEYQGYESKEQITFLRPPQAKFRVVKTLKGPPLGPNIFVRYELYDPSSGKIPKELTFTKNRMPATGEQFMLFLVKSNPQNGIYETSHGTRGRLALSETALEAIKCVQEKGGFNGAILQSAPPQSKPAEQ